MSTGSEIEANTFRCNACWKTITNDICYKTGCNHLFCKSCSERFFSKQMICPLCDTSVEGENNIVELSANRSLDVASATFSYHTFYPNDALTITAEATSFARAQTALYGTREIWIRSKETETTQRKLVDCENRLNTVMTELSVKSKEIQELGERLIHRTTLAEESERKVRNIERLYAQATGRAVGTLITTLSPSSNTTTGLSTNSNHHGQHQNNSNGGGGGYFQNNHPSQHHPYLSSSLMNNNNNNGGPIIPPTTRSMNTGSGSSLIGNSNNNPMNTNLPTITPQRRLSSGSMMDHHTINMMDNSNNHNTYRPLQQENRLFSNTCTTNTSKPLDSTVNNRGRPSSASLVTGPPLATLSSNNSHHHQPHSSLNHGNNGNYGGNGGIHTTNHNNNILVVPPSSSSSTYSSVPPPTPRSSIVTTNNGQHLRLIVQPPATPLLNTSSSSVSTSFSRK